MITLEKLLEGIEKSYKIIDDSLSVLSRVNYTNVSVSEVNSIIEHISMELEKVGKVIKLLQAARESLPRYLSWLSGSSNMLQQSLDNASIDILEVHDFTTKKGSDRVTITEKISLNVKMNNSIIKLRNELSNCKFILNRMYAKLQ